MSSEPLDPGIEDTMPAPEDGPPAPATSPAGDLPRAIDRFQVTAKLGQGGMGTVLLAHDPRLDRDVALKLVSCPTAPTPEVAAMFRHRLMHEARAMARLQHDSVAKVFEVGEAGETVFIAMEYLAGGTLAEWLAEPRSWRAVVAALLEAGEGLRVAHDAGIVHRDFKPDNVMFDGAGSVKVTDFGVARTMDAPPVGEAGTAKARFSSPWQTETGALVGTPVYMAPEQHLGLPPDPLTDQFSFCVTLFEALWGRRPFHGDTLPELARAIIQGKVVWSSHRSVPRRLRSLIRRGLSSDPKHRYPSMKALLTELRAIRRPSTSRWLAAAAPVLAVALAIGSWAVKTGKEPPDSSCTQSASRLLGVWDEPRKRQVHSAFMSTGKPHAAPSYERFDATISAYATDWTTAHRTVCEATHVLGEQSFALLDRRMECLDRRLQELDLLVGAVTAQPDETLDRSVSAAYELTDVARCQEIAAPTALVPLPDDEQLRLGISQLRRTLDEAQALKRAGRWTQARDLLEPALERARAIDHPPATAEILYLLSFTESLLGRYDRAEQLARESAHQAAAAGDRWLFIKALNRLMFDVGYHERRIEDGQMYALHARLALAESPDDLLRADFFHYQAVVLRESGRLADGIDSLRQALALRRQLLGDEHPKTFTTMNNLGLNLVRMGRYQEAEQLLMRSIELRERIQGAQHPYLASTFNNLANLYLRTGRYRSAREVADRAVGLRNASLGARHARTGNALGTIGDLEYLRENYRDALTFYNQVRSIFLESYGPAHAKVGSILHRHGRTLAQLDRLDEARAAVTEGSAVIAATVGDRHIHYADTLRSRGIVAMRAGAYQDARAAFAQSLELFTELREIGHRDWVEVLLDIADLALLEGDLAAARTRCQEALTHLSTGDRDTHPLSARARVCLVRSQPGQDRSESRAVLDEAARILENSGVGGIALLEVDVVRWLVGDRDPARGLALRQELQRVGPEQAPARARTLLEELDGHTASGP